MECSEVMLIFAASKGEFAERMTARFSRLQGKNLYGLQRSFRAPNITSPHRKVVALLFTWIYEATKKTTELLELWAFECSCVPFLLWQANKFERVASGKAERPLIGKRRKPMGVRGLRSVFVTGVPVLHHRRHLRRTLRQLRYNFDVKKSVSSVKSALPKLLALRNEKKNMFFFCISFVFQ